MVLGGYSEAYFGGAIGCGKESLVEFSVKVRWIRVFTACGMVKDSLVVQNRLNENHKEYVWYSRGIIWLNIFNIW